MANYNSVEYLCKNVKAKAALSWVVALRNDKQPQSPKSVKSNGDPPRFWADDMDKWEKKLQLANKLRIEEMKKIKNNFNYSLDDGEDCVESKVLTRFSTIDAVLLKGNTNPV